MAVLHHPCYRPSSEVILEFRLYRHYCKLTVSVPRLVAPLVMASPLTSPVASPLLSVNVGNTGNVSASAPASVNQYGSNDALAVQLSTMAAGIASMQSLTTDMCGIMRAAFAPAPASAPASAPAPAPAPAQVEVAPVIALATPVDSPPQLLQALLQKSRQPPIPRRAAVPDRQKER